MPLVELTTNLKSLEFGRDRPNGADSGQPYIVKKIPEGESLGGGFIRGPLINIATINNQAINQNRPGIGVLSKTSDFILRGGQLAFLRSAEDVLRLTKYITDTNPPQGPLFVAKQQLLSKLSVRTLGSGALLNAKPFLPTGIIAQAGGNAFGVHTVKQGLNQIRNSFGDVTPGDYFTNARYITFEPDESNNSLLVNLSKAAVGNTDATFKGFNLNPNSNTVLSYSGGPGSILGLGTTRIKYSDLQRTFSKNSRFESILSSDQNPKSFALLTLSQIYEAATPGNTAVKEDFRKIFVDENSEGERPSSKIVSVSPSYTGDKTYFQRTNIGNPGTHIATGNTRDLVDYSYDPVTAIPLDKINASLPLNSVDSEGDGDDLIRFKFEIIDNDSAANNITLLFRAFINSFNDSYTGNWNTVKYVGRGDNFYSYGGFDRKISFDFTVAVQSKPELIPVFQKLNYLASTLAPDYSAGGFMRGNLIRLTMGGYLNRTYGFLDSLTFNIPQESPYEIAIDKDGNYDNTVAQLPHIINVNASFVPLHNFLVEKADSAVDPSQKYISLTSPNGTNLYNTDYSDPLGEGFTLYQQQKQQQANL